MTDNLSSDKMNSDRIDSTIRATRAKLDSTFEAIEDKFNEPKKQVSAFVERTKTSYESNPIPYIIGATAAAIVVVGLVAWAIFSDDDD
jgi:hypothetical protein